MARVTADEFVTKWQTRTQAASPEYVKGVRAVQQAPGTLAAAKKAQYVANVNASADKWANRVGAVGLSTWQDAAAGKGATNLATGVQAAGPKMQAAATRLLSTVDSVRNRVKGMPNATLEQRLARANAMARGMYDAYNK